MSALLRTLAAAPLALAVTLLGAAPAQASVIYTYTGSFFTDFASIGTPPDPYTTTNRVTAVLELATPLAPLRPPLAAVAPLSFTVADGSNTITKSTAIFATFGFGTDANGHITSWSFLVISGATTVGGARFVAIQSTVPSDIATVDICGPLSTTTSCDASTSTAQGFVNDAPGNWTMREAPVPEPSSLALIGFALAGLVARRRVR